MVEVLIASVILAMAVTYIAQWLINAKKLFRVSHFQYVALNMARDLMEFGEASQFQHNNVWECIYTGGGYNTYYSAIGVPRKFSNAGCLDLGDIKTKGLVPPGDPNSVYILFESIDPIGFPNMVCGTAPGRMRACQTHVKISWMEGGITHSRELSTISMNQVNIGLNLHLKSFTHQ